MFKNVSLLLLIALSFAFIYLLSSCEKEVHINLGNSAPRLVVEGEIFTGGPPIVTLTNSIGFFSSIDYSTIQNAFVHGAVITVSDGSQTITLKEYSLDTANNSKFFVYSADLSDPNAKNFVGQVGKYYTLNINYNGQTYSSITMVPPPIHIDSVTLNKLADPPARFPDAIGLVVHFKDPDTPGNYARYFTKRNSEPYYAGDIYDDEITNGAPVDWHIHPGTNLSMPDSESTFYFYKGDTVTVIWSSIDKGVFTFWNTFEYASAAVGNPFASPINTKSNITNNALGVWAGYGIDSATIIIPK
jgi:hypothetical protein